MNKSWLRLPSGCVRIQIIPEGVSSQWSQAWLPAYCLWNFSIVVHTARTLCVTQGPNAHRWCLPLSYPLRLSLEWEVDCSPLTLPFQRLALPLWWWGTWFLGRELHRPVEGTWARLKTMTRPGRWVLDSPNWTLTPQQHLNQPSSRCDQPIWRTVFLSLKYLTPFLCLASRQFCLLWHIVPVCYLIPSRSHPTILLGDSNNSETSFRAQDWC